MKRCLNRLISSASRLSFIGNVVDIKLVFIIKGESYRGRKLETIAVEAGGTSMLLGTKN